MAPSKILAWIFSIYIISAVSAARSITGSESQSESVQALIKNMFGNPAIYSLSRNPPPTESVTINTAGTMSGNTESIEPIVTSTARNTSSNTGMYSLSRKPPLTESVATNSSGNTAMYSLSRKPGSTEAISTKRGGTTSNDTAKPASSREKTRKCNDEPCQFLRAHNQVRASMGEPPLIWDPELEKYARWWVGQRKGDCALQHSFPQGGFQVGENLFWGGGSGWTPQNAVDVWADERKYYNFETNSCQAGRQCLHYTQIVWKKTTRVGCVRALCDKGDVFISCNYSPPGNYEGERPY